MNCMKKMMVWGEPCKDFDNFRVGEELEPTDEVETLYQILIRKTIEDCRESEWKLPFLVAKPAVREKVIPIIVLTHAEHQVVDMLLKNNIPYVVELLHDFLIKIEKFVKNKRPDSKVKVVLEKEPEEPKNYLFTIVLKTEFKNCEEQMSLWESIEGIIQELVDDYLDKAKLESKKKLIKVANGLITTSVTK